MKKLTHLYIVAFLALTLGLMLSCAKDEEYSDSSGSTKSYTVSGHVQKGPYVQGTEITVRELGNNLSPTGRTFTGTIEDNTGTFSAKGDLSSPYVELSADGYYFNEVSGSLSTAKLTLSALSDLTDSSSVNVNLMTHLEKKRVENLMDNSKITLAAAKTQAQTEILKIFNIENVTLGNSETLDISQSGDGNAVLLAISAILQSDKTEAELTELLSTINTDIRTDGTLDSTNTKATLVTAMEYLKARQSTIRSNIESRYSNLGISASIPAFESYAFKLDTTAPTVSSTSPADSGTSVSYASSISVTFSEMMDSTSVTSNTSDSSCSGTFQVSSNNFSTCVQMSSSPTISNSNKTFAFTPSSSLSFSTTYKIRLTTGVKDHGAINALSSQYETGTGFTTEASPNYVAVGNDGAIFTSSDGTTWTSRTSGTSSTLRAVTYVNSIFMAVGNGGTILTSSDGTTWTSKTSGTGNVFYGVTFGNNTFVAAGQTTILTSSDGTTWTSRTSGVLGTNDEIKGVTFGNSTFVIIGGTGTILTSSNNGTSWDNRTSGTTSHLFGVTYGNSTFVTVGRDGTILTSSDGTTWTSRTSGTTSDIKAVTYANSIFMAVSGSQTFTSSDGITWTARSSCGGNSVTFGNSIFVMVYGNVYTSSNNGVTCTQTAFSSDFGSKELHGVASK